MPLNENLILLLAAYFSVLIGFSVAKRSYFSGRAIYLLRAFFPSWRFFEDLGEMPTLYYRLRNEGQELGHWKLGLEKPNRSAGSFFLNPEGNYLLACGSLLQHLESELEETEENKTDHIEASVTYQLIRNLVLHQIEKSEKATGFKQYQFKITSALPGKIQDAQDSIDDLLISPVYERGSI